MVHTNPKAIRGINPITGRSELIETRRARMKADNLILTSTWQQGSGFQYADTVVGSGRTTATSPHRSARAAWRVRRRRMVLASVEVGQDFALSDTISLEPQAQVSLCNLDSDRTTGLDDVVVDLKTVAQFVWRAGVRAVLRAKWGLMARC